jgi:hypothetical protein
VIFQVTFMAVLTIFLCLIDVLICICRYIWVSGDYTTNVGSPIDVKLNCPTLWPVP